MRGHLSFGRYLMNLNYHMMNRILLLFGRALWVRNWIKQHWNTSFNDYSCKNWSKAVDKILGHLIFQLRVEIIVVCDSSLLVWSFYTVFVALVAHISGRLVSISKMYGRAKHHMMWFSCLWMPWIRHQRMLQQMVLSPKSRNRNPLESRFHRFHIGDTTITWF